MLHSHRCLLPAGSNGQAVVLYGVEVREHYGPAVNILPGYDSLTSKKDRYQKTTSSYLCYRYEQYSIW